MDQTLPATGTTISPPGPTLNVDPRFQTITILTPSLTGSGFDQVETTPAEISSVYFLAFNTAIGYSAQIGACFIMLLVLLTMTAKARFARIPTVINTAALVVSIIRCTLLVVFFTSTMMEFYTVFSDDFSYVHPNDVRRSVAATVFAPLQLALVEAALMVQAWAMVELWPRTWKVSGIAFSLLLASVTVAFKCASAAITVKSALEPLDPRPYLWIRQTDLAFTTAMVTWFCFLFNVRLVMHMWQNRSILPTVKGLSPMEVLVMANGLLMVFPVLFAGLYYGDFGQFESASLTITSVVLVLPLGTLVAQRLAVANTVAGSTGTTDMDDKLAFLGNATTATHHSSSAAGRSRLASPRLHSQLSTSVSAGKPRVDPIDLELQRIDDDDGDFGRSGSAGGVRIERSIERREERL
ncbi:hypothetical protein PpBr36_05443, partial [Pyricularia pennisetigena]|uniref:hypothetical protein n=1 Tax=Pyricularia pennisetigena TaxID=1578925 RepID=UPI00114D8AA7